MNKLELLKQKLEQARKELIEKGYSYNPEMYSKYGYNELMKIKPFEIKYQEVIENIWKDEPWWKVLNYWDIFDAMASGDFSDETIIDEIVSHVSPEYLEESCKLSESVDELKSICDKYGCKFEDGHTLSEWMRHYHEEYDNGELWDFSLEDIKSGAVEPQKGLVYWLIKDGGTDEVRAYETTEFCEECSEGCKSLKEGTSNFGWLRKFPLLVFYTYDEVEDRIRNSSDYPNLEQFTTDKGHGDFHVDYDAYYEACDKFEQDSWDEIETAVLDEEQVEELENAIYDFNEKTQRIAEDLYDAGNEDDYYVLKGIELKVEPGYYEAAYIDVDDEKEFDYLSDKVKEEQLKRFHDFFDTLKKEHGLSHYEVAWGPASNGETGYRKVESCENCEEDLDAPVEESAYDKIVKVLDDYGILYGDVVDYDNGKINIVGVDSEEWEEAQSAIESELGYEVDLPSGEGNDDELVVHVKIEESLKEEMKEDDCHVNTNAGDPIKNAEFFNASMGMSSAGAVGEDLKESISEDEYDKLVDASEYAGQLLDFYDLSEETGEIFERVYNRLGYPVDEEWVIHPEVLKDEKKVEELYDVLREDVVAFLNDGYRLNDVKDDVIAIFEIEHRYESLNKKEQVNEELTVTTDDTNVIVHSDGSAEVSNADGVVTVTNNEVSVDSENVSVVKDDSGVTVTTTSVGPSEEVVNVETEVVAEPEVAISSEEEVIAPASEEEIKSEDETVVAEESLEKHVCEKCGKEVCECDKQKLTEEPVYNLGTRYDSRNSFYGKAKVDAREDGSQILYSYNTPVCMITKDGEVKLLRKGYLGWFSSPTTLRHVKEFLKQNNKEVGTKNELSKMYPTEDAYDYIK